MSLPFFFSHSKCPRLSVRPTSTTATPSRGNSMPSPRISRSQAVPWGWRRTTGSITSEAFKWIFASWFIQLLFKFTISDYTFVAENSYAFITRWFTVSHFSWYIAFPYALWSPFHVFFSGFLQWFRKNRLFLDLSPCDATSCASPTLPPDPTARALCISPLCLEDPLA